MLPFVAFASSTQLAAERIACAPTMVPEQRPEPDRMVTRAGHADGSARFSSAGPSAGGSAALSFPGGAAIIASGGPALAARARTAARHTIQRFLSMCAFPYAAR